jgi:hypothetical protein
MVNSANSPSLVSTFISPPWPLVISGEEAFPDDRDGRGLAYFVLHHF